MAPNKSTSLVKLNKDHYVTRANSLIMAHHDLSLTELKIVYAIISSIKMDDKRLSKCKMKVSALAEFCQIGATNYWGTIKDITNSILKKVIIIEEEDGKELQTHYVSSALYIQKEGTVEFALDDNLTPYVIDLKTKFTSIKAEELMCFKSLYAARLYEVLYSYLKIGGRKYYTPDELRYVLDIRGKSYEAMGNVQKRVIIPAIEEINKKTKCYVTVDYEKLGKTIAKIKFEIKEKDLSEQLKTIVSNQKEEVFEILKKVGLEKQTDKLLEKYSANRIVKNAEKVLKKKNIQDRAAYTMSAIIDDYEQIDTPLFEQPEINAQQKEALMPFASLRKEYEDIIKTNENLINVEDIKD